MLSMSPTIKHKTIKQKYNNNTTERTMTTMTKFADLLRYIFRLYILTLKIVHVLV